MDVVRHSALQRVVDVENFVTQGSIQFKDLGIRPVFFLLI